MTSARTVAPTLQADALEKGFMSGDVQVPVLRGLSLDIYPGELTLVSGPSGCGRARCCRCCPACPRPMAVACTRWARTWAT